MELHILHYALNGSIDTSEGTSNTTPIVPKESYQINFLNNVLTLTFNSYMWGREVSASIDIPVNTDKDMVLDVIARESDLPLELSICEAFTFVGRLTNIANMRHSGKKIARVAWSKNDTVVYLLLLVPHVDIQGYTNETIDNINSSTAILINKVPWVRDRLNLIKKKALLINHVDYYRSIAYLEAQVDILTRIVLSFIPNESELSNLLLLADKNSVLNIKPINDLQQELVDNKGALRRRQESYYERLMSHE